MSRLTRYALLGILFVAFFFRTHELAGLGLGLEHDEVAEWQIADGIRHGEHALFFKEAYGQEPLFLYLMAGSIAFLGDNVMGVRFTSVFVAMLTLAATFRLLRRMFGPTVALVAVAFMAIALWPVFWGRVALRAMTLPLMLALGFDWLWRGLTADSRRPTTGRRSFAMAGLFFGLSAYTYLSSRALPILLAAFTVYLALFARDRVRGKWRGLFASYIIGALMALPLAITLLANPDLQFRVSEVSGPLDKAMQGDWSEVGANVSRALGMFTVKGDNTVRDNWPDRPVFPEPMGALLFGVGVILSLSRFRQPRYALAVLWLGAMLIPTIVTTGAPNFTRTLGALPLAFAMPGIAVDWALFWLPRLVPVQNFVVMSRVTGALGSVALIGVLGVNTLSTYKDYFIKWPNHPETQFVFQADFAAIAKDIDAGDVMDVSVGGLSNATMDEPSLYLLRQRKDVRVRWFDSGSPLSSGGAIVNPAAYPSASLYLPSIVPLSPRLQYILSSARQSKQTEHYRRYRGLKPLLQPDVKNKWIRDFADLATLFAARILPESVSVNGDLQFESYWVAGEPITSSLRIFVHLVDPATGRIVAQHDGLDAPNQFWRPNDEVFQLHTLHISSDTAPGRYEVWLGLYDPVTGDRIMQIDSTHLESPGDQYLVDTIEVTR
jgi:4-amino-4-deoxy-L-arabinose transferase-like glycosyltransferase